jgi:hypothetical protein
MSAVARQLARTLRPAPHLTLVIPFEGRPDLRAWAASAEDEARMWDYALSSPTIRAILEAVLEADAA